MGCMSCCFLQTVHEDVWWIIPVPQSGLHGWEQAGAEQRLLRCQQTPPWNWELQAAALRVCLDHRGVVRGESPSPSPHRDCAAQHRATLSSSHRWPCWDIATQINSGRAVLRGSIIIFRFVSVRNFPAGEKGAGLWETRILKSKHQHAQSHS